MNPQYETTAPAAADKPQSQFRNPQSESSTGRPRALNDAKRSEIIQLIADGLGLEHAARHVGCSIRTIRREMKRDPDFGNELRRSEKYAQLNPLGAIQHAIRRNWRAAAWLLERLFPERFARQPQTSALGARQARQLLNEVLHIVQAEVIDAAQRGRVDGRIRAAFEYRIHVYCSRKRSKAGLNRAIEWFVRKDEQHDPLADLGLFTCSPNAIHNPSRMPADATEPPTPKAGQSKRRTPQTSLPMSEAFQALIDQLKVDLKVPLPREMKPSAEPQQGKSQMVSPGASPVDKTTDSFAPPRSKTP